MLPTTNTKSIDVDFNVSVVTRQTTAKLLTAIVDFLAFHRNQIPFVYQTFQFMVDRLMKLESSDDWQNFHVKQQRAVAQSTLQYYNLLRKRIVQTLESVEIEQALFVLGATSSTPKEAFIINLPAVNDSHFIKNHSNSDTSLARSVTLSITESQELFEHTSHNAPLGVTNMYMYLSPRSRIAKCNLEHFHMLENYELPLHSCRTTIFNLRNCSNRRQINLNNLAILSDADSAATHLTSITGTHDVEMEVEGVAEQRVWYEMNTFVRGFKDVLVKGKSIWE